MRRLRRMAAAVGEKLDEPRLSVAPLIDVCFLLLIYFMVTTTLEPPERDVSTRMLSEGPPTPRMPVPSVMVEVRADGVIVLNPGPHEVWMSTDPADRNLPRLKDHLETVMIGVDELPPLLVRADNEAQHQRVVDVMNLLQEIGWTRVGFLDEAGP